MFGRHRRQQTAELRSLQAKLAEIDAAAIARSERMASMLMERMQSSEAGRDSVVEHLWRKVIEQDQDLAGAIEHVANLCDVIAERLEAQRLEQRQVGELLSSLSLQLTTSTSSPAGPRAIGGSFVASEPPPHGATMLEIEESRDGALIGPGGTPSEAWSDVDDRETAGTDTRLRDGWRRTR